MTYAWKHTPASFLATEVTAVLGKTKYKQGSKDSRSQELIIVFKIFTRTLEPFDKPFDKLTVLSEVEGLTALSTSALLGVEGPLNP
jgi:hypothetical protein